MTAAPPKPPNTPKFPRGGLRPLLPEGLEDESVYRGVVLEGADLSATRLHAVSFEGAVFREVRLVGAVWSHARFVDVRFEGCDLSGMVCPDAAFQRVQFTDCRLLGWQVPEAVWQHVRLTRVQAHLALCLQLDARHTWFEDCDLTEATFMNAKLPGAVFRDCLLPRTDFRGASLTGADLRGSSLAGARLGLPELESVTVEPVQLLDLAHVLGVQVQSLETPETARKG